MPSASWGQRNFEQPIEQLIEQLFINKGAAVQMLTDACGDVQLVPTLEVVAQDAAGLLALIEYASALRATHATGVHDASSRSHAICRIGIQRTAHAFGKAGSLTLAADPLGGAHQNTNQNPSCEPITASR